MIVGTRRGGNMVMTLVRVIVAVIVRMVMVVRMAMIVPVPLELGCVAVRADTLHVMVMALLGQTHLRLETQDLGPVLA